MGVRMGVRMGVSRDVSTGLSMGREHTSHLERRCQRVSGERDAARDARRQRRRVRRNRRGRRGRRHPWWHRTLPGRRHTLRRRHRSRRRRLVFLRRRPVLLVDAATVLIEEPGDGWTAASAQHGLRRWPWPEAGEGKRGGEQSERHQQLHRDSAISLSELIHRDGAISPRNFGLNLIA